MTTDKTQGLFVVVLRYGTVRVPQLPERHSKPKRHGLARWINDS